MQQFGVIWSICTHELGE